MRMMLETTLSSLLSLSLSIVPTRLGAYGLTLVERRARKVCRLFAGAAFDASCSTPPVGPTLDHERTSLRSRGWGFAVWPDGRGHPTLEADEREQRLALASTSPFSTRHEFARDPSDPPASDDGSAAAWRRTRRRFPRRWPLRTSGQQAVPAVEQGRRGGPRAGVAGVLRLTYALLPSLASQPLQETHRHRLMPTPSLRGHGHPREAVDLSFGSSRTAGGRPRLIGGACLPCPGRSDLRGVFFKAGGPNPAFSIEPRGPVASLKFERWVMGRVPCATRRSAVVR